MVVEVEEKYHFEGGLPQHQINPKAIEFYKKHGYYPAKVILNWKYQDLGRIYFILFPTKQVPAIKPLANKDIEELIAQGYYADVEYDKEVNETTLICRGSAKTS